MPLSSGSYTVVLGFVQEIKGRNRDTAWFSVIDGERPTLRETSEWVECSRDALIRLGSPYAAIKS